MGIGLCPSLWIRIKVVSSRIKTLKKVLAIWPAYGNSTQVVWINWGLVFMKWQVKCPTKRWYLQLHAFCHNPKVSTQIIREIGWLGPRRVWGWNIYILVKQIDIYYSKILIATIQPPKKLKPFIMVSKPRELDKFPSLIMQDKKIIISFHLK